MTAPRRALLLAVPVGVAFAGPAVLGTGWLRLAAAGVGLVCLMAALGGGQQR